MITEFKQFFPNFHACVKFQIFPSSSPSQAIMRYWKTKKKKKYTYFFF